MRNVHEERTYNVVVPHSMMIKNNNNNTQADN